MRFGGTALRDAILRGLAISAVLVAAGCAATDIGLVDRETPDARLRPPHTVAVVVQDVSPDGGLFPAGRHEDARQTAAALTQSLTTLFGTRKLTVVPPGHPADLILSCRVVDITGGDTALRVLVGYGAGVAVLKVGVTLTDARTAARPPLLRFETDSTTGGMPGAAFGLASGFGGDTLALSEAVAGIPGKLKQGLAREVAQTTARIDEQIGLYFVAQHWPYATPVPSSLGAWAVRS